MRKFVASFLVLLSLSCVSLARAGEPDLLSLSVGQYDIFDDQQALEYVLEYRAKSINWWKISPLIGVMGTADGAAYGFAGIGGDFYIADRWILNPNFAVGGYRDGSGKKLGHGIEFRSGLELNYKFDNQSRAGIAFNHISNASLGDSNPGTESLLFTYAVPLDSFYRGRGK